MAKAGPKDGRIYSRSEVIVMFDFSSTDALGEAVQAGRFPLPMQQTRQAEPQWTGEVLRAWVLIMPLLRRADPPGPATTEKKAPRKSGELGGNSPELEGS